MKRVYSGWNRSWCGTGRHNSGWSRKNRGYYVYVALQKKILAMPKGHEQLRTVATMIVAAEGDMGYDHRGSSFGHVGENLSLDNKERRGRHHRTSDRRGAMVCVPFFIYGRSSSTVTVAAQSILCHLGRTEDKSAWPTCNLWNLVFPKMSSFS
ncbi:hypothetical protein B296_00051648 [Ensete ventricosum]|uniref:Uncharacterized protein n=1 Tax=Ensete ventricosum TaxID=4639 RepID=A0A426YG05_ENSVE|nr:hypothetical protein B296_00051648 [Ensete ventricosum]